MKRNRDSMKYDLSVDHRPLKKQKNEDSDVDPSSFILQERSPPQILSPLIPQNPLTPSTNNQPSLPFRRSVLDERDHPRVLTFNQFNEERRKRDLKVLTREQYDFLQKYKSPEKWQLPQNELSEEILRVLRTKESGVFMTVKEVKEVIVKEKRVNSEYLEKSKDCQRSAVQGLLLHLSRAGVLDQRRRIMKGKRPSPEFSSKYFEGIQTYQIIPLLNLKNAVLYTLTFASKKLKKGEIYDDIQQRMEEESMEFRTKIIVKYCFDLSTHIQSLIREGESIEFVEKEGNSVARYYFLRERADLSINEDTEDFRRGCVIRVLRKSKKPMTRKEIQKNSKNLSRYSEITILKTLHKMIEEGVLKREINRRGLIPFMYSLNRRIDDEEEYEEEELVEEENLIIAGKRNRKSILRPEKLVEVPRSNVILNLDDAIVLVLQNSVSPLYSYEICEEIEARKKKNEFWVEDFTGSDIGWTLRCLLRKGLIQKKGEKNTHFVRYFYSHNQINPPPLSQSFFKKRRNIPSIKTLRRVQSNNDIKLEIIESENGAMSIFRTINLDQSHVLINSNIRLLEEIRTIQNVLVIRNVISNESPRIIYHFYNGEPSIKMFRIQGQHKQDEISNFLKEVCSSILDLLPFGILFFANLDDILFKEKSGGVEIRILLNEQNFRFSKRSDDSSDEKFVDHTRKFINEILKKMEKSEITKEKESIKKLIGKLYSML